jgi:hypothetical protein
MPFVFILPALMARLAFPGPAYQILFYASIKVEMFAPFLGLLLGVLAWRDRIGKVAVGLNLLAVGYNYLWISVFLPQALKHTKLF